MLAGTLGHVLFLFLTAAVIAFLLNPLVRDLQGMRLPRGLAVALVFLLFAAAVAVHRAGARERRRRPDPLGRRSDRQLRHGRGRGRQDRRRTGHRPASGVARRPRPRADPDPEAGDRLGRQPGGGRDLEVHPGRDLLRTGCGVLDRRDPLQPGPDRRHRHLHAARHAAARRGDRPAVPPGRRALVDRADRACPCRLCAGAADPLDRDRAQRGRRDVDPGYAPGSSRAPSATRCSSASGPR